MGAAGNDLKLPRHPVGPVDEPAGYGFGRRLSMGRSGVQDVRACLRDVRERHGVLSDECRGKEQALGWYTRQ